MRHSYAAFSMAWQKHDPNAIALSPAAEKPFVYNMPSWAIRGVGKQMFFDSVVCEYHPAPLREATILV